MVLEMKQALESLKRGDLQGYRKIYDVSCEDVYCRSYLVIQKEAQATEFVQEFYTDLFGMLDEADDVSNLEKWFWQKYYQRMRKQYHALLADQVKRTSLAGCTLAEIPSALPLLHRIMLVMSDMDNFTAGEIAVIYGLDQEKVQGELEKLNKILPSLVKGQPDSVAGYLGSWKSLLIGAVRQLKSTGSDEWKGQVYVNAADAAGIQVEPALKKDETFEYFVADVDLDTVSTPKKTAPDKVQVQEEPEEDGEYDDDDEYDNDEYDDDDEYDDNDEYDDEEDDEDDEDDGRYDWDLEDDGRKMVILGVVLALVIVAVIGFFGFRLLNKDNDTSKDPVQTEEESGEAELIIKGDAPGEGDTEAQEQPEEVPEEEPEESEEPEEPETLVMQVKGSNINVRSEATTDSSVVTKVNAPEHVEVLGDPNGEWVQIRCTDQNGEEGYVKSEFLSGIAAE